MVSHLKTDIYDVFISPTTGLNFYCDGSNIGRGPMLIYIRPTAYSSSELS